MKKRNLIHFIAVIALMMTFTIPGVAGNVCPSVTILLQTEPSEHNQDLDREGNRAPSRPVYCTISEEGVLITGVSRPEILLYEIFDEDEICLVSTSEDQIFLNFILSHSGIMTVKFTLEDKCLSGQLDT